MNELGGLLRHDDQSADHQKHGYKSKQDVANAANDGALGGCIQTVGGHHPLKYVLLRNGAKHDGDGGCHEKQNVFHVGFRQKLEQVLADSQGQYFVCTTRLIARKHRQRCQADHQNNHLHEVRDGHGPHATKQGVGQHRHHTNGHSQWHADDAI